MRLFVALDIDDTIRDRLAGFLDGARGFVPDARWARPESLHVTLKFIGEKATSEIEKITTTLETIVADPFEMSFRGYGFFPGPGAPRVFWIGIEAGPSLASVAAMVDDKLASLGIPREGHPFNPHLTLARNGSGSGSPRKQKGDRPNRSFQRLQEKLTALPAPEFGTMTVREFFLYQSQLYQSQLYQSQLSPGGSKYTKLAGFHLRAPVEKR